jgi:hypothetical protein
MIHLNQFLSQYLGIGTIAITIYAAFCLLHLVIMIRKIIQREGLQ